MGTKYYHKDGSITYYDPGTKETTVLKPATGGSTSGSGSSVSGGIASSVRTDKPSTGNSTSNGGNSQYSGWKPADTSGVDYDQKYMSANDYAQVKAWRDEWGSASPERQQELHELVEGRRAKYLYSGGDDGSQYLPFEQQQSTGGGFSYGNAPSYTDKYSAQIEALLSDILNRDDFSYDALNDPLYQQYSQQYLREGQRAMQDTLGAASARTGGLASSWATTAAQQANDYYASQIADKIPELYQLAYSMYLDDIDLKMQDAGLLQSMSDTQYNRYRDTMSDWRDDRNFAYDMYRDDIADNRWGTEFGYGAIRDQVSDNRYDQSEAQERINAYLTAGGNVADLDGALRSASGYTEAELTALEKYYAGLRGEDHTAAYTDGGSDPSGVSGYNNGKLTEAEVKLMQRYYGLTADGKWGPNSKQNTGMNADEAWEKYQNTDGTTASAYGTSYNTAWSQARKMFDSGATDEKIMEYLDTFSEDRLTEDGLRYIMNSLNLGGYRE